MNRIDGRYNKHVSKIDFFRNTCLVFLLLPVASMLPADQTRRDSEWL